MRTLQNPTALFVVLAGRTTLMEMSLLPLAASNLVVK
jgi:hypothetical protein